MKQVKVVFDCASVKLDRHLVHSVVVLSSTLVLLLILFVSLIGLCTSPRVALR